MTTPTAAQARELARELRTFPPMLQDSTPYDAATTRGHIVNYVKDNALDIAATLDALVAENAKLREAVARIDNMRRGPTGYSDVFYALEAGEITVAKAMQCVRLYLTTGDAGEFAHAAHEREEAK